MDLIDRECKNPRCLIKWKTLATSKQEYCNKGCECDADGIKGMKKIRIINAATNRAFKDHQKMSRGSMRERGKQIKLWMQRN